MLYLESSRILHDGCEIWHQDEMGVAEAPDVTASITYHCLYYAKFPCIPTMKGIKGREYTWIIRDGHV